MNSIEKLKQLLDKPAALKSVASNCSINPSGCFLVNDNSQKRIKLIGSITANNHDARHTKFLEKRQKLLQESTSNRTSSDGDDF